MLKPTPFESKGISFKLTSYPSGLPIFNLCASKLESLTRAVFSDISSFSIEVSQGSK